jgi:hypothetical protein
MKLLAKGNEIHAFFSPVECRMIAGTPKGKRYSLPSDPDETELKKLLEYLWACAVVFHFPSKYGLSLIEAKAKVDEYLY